MADESDTTQPEVLQAAIHPAAKVIARALRHRAEQIKDGSMGSAQTETPNQIAEEALAAAAPALRQQGAEEERERLREAVTKPIYDLATHIGRACIEIEDLPDPPAVVAAADELKLVSEAMSALRLALFADNQEAS